MTTLGEHLPALRDAVDSHQAGRVPTVGGSILIDVQTAHAVLTVRDALNDNNRATLDAMPVDRAGLLVWRLLEKRKP